MDIISLDGKSYESAKNSICFQFSPYDNEEIITEILKDYNLSRHGLVNCWIVYQTPVRNSGHTKYMMIAFHGTPDPAIFTRKDCFDYFEDAGIGWTTYWFPILAKYDYQYNKTCNPPKWWNEINRYLKSHKISPKKVWDVV